MSLSPRHAFHGVPLLLAIVSLAGIVALLSWDIRPQLLRIRSHGVLGAFPLATIGFAWLGHHATKHASIREWFKAALLAAAFYFWAANQCLRDAHTAMLCNDIAIALFVLDLVFTIARSPGTRQPT